MFRRESRPVLIRRILLLIIVFAASQLQNTDGLLPTFFGARQLVLIPLTVCISMCEGELSGVLYGAFGGCLWDVCAGGPDGIHALYLAVIGCLAGLLVHYYMRNKLLSQYILTSAATFIYVIMYWFISVYSVVGDAQNEKLLSFYLPSAVITTLLSFIVYYPIRSLHVKLKDQEEKSL